MSQLQFAGVGGVVACSRLYISLTLDTPVTGVKRRRSCVEILMAASSHFCLCVAHLPVQTPLALQKHVWAMSPFLLHA